MLTGPVFSMCSADTTVAGPTPARSWRRMREPVTTMSDPFGASSAAGDCVAASLCASAGVAKVATAAALASKIVLIIIAKPPDGYLRSEEHTSELQSLMRNSYDVFCLK